MRELEELSLSVSPSKRKKRLRAAAVVRSPSRPPAVTASLEDELPQVSVASMASGDVEPVAAARLRRAPPREERPLPRAAPAARPAELPGGKDSVSALLVHEEKTPPHAGKRAGGGAKRRSAGEADASSAALHAARRKPVRSVHDSSSLRRSVLTGPAPFEGGDDGAAALRKRRERPKPVTTGLPADFMPAVPKRSTAAEARMPPPVLPHDAAAGDPPAGTRGDVEPPIPRPRSPGAPGRVMWTEGIGVMNDNLPAPVSVYKEVPVVGGEASARLEGEHSVPEIRHKLEVLLPRDYGVPSRFTNDLPPAVQRRIRAFERIDSRRTRLRDIVLGDRQQWVKEMKSVELSASPEERRAARLKSARRRRGL
eukprot:PLAT8246.1.p1 GENE.PLAT8246.1~~PLAT8246.1.p1  ORF type:complete len:428 (-),score=87.50 PLAT8246.1:70-1173(-)